MEKNKELFSMESSRRCIIIYEDMQRMYHPLSDILPEKASAVQIVEAFSTKDAAERLIFFAKYYIIIFQESLSENLEKVDKFSVTNMCSRAPYIGVFQWSYRMSIKNLLSRLFMETRMRCQNWWKSSTDRCEVMCSESRCQKT